MGILRVGAVIISAVFWASGAASAPATADGAAALERTFEAYVGSTRGIVAVRPVGESYEVVLDFFPYLSLLPAEIGSAALSPFPFTLSDRGNGTWAVSYDFEGSFSLKVEGQMEMSVDIGKLSGSGIFDTRLMAFETSTALAEDLSMRQVSTSPGMGEAIIDYRIARMQADQSASPSAAGGVDVQTHILYTDLTERVTMPAGAMSGTEGPIEVTLSVAEGVSDATAAGVRTASIYGLWAWAVAHPSPEAILADQEGLRGKLSDLGPLFESLSAKSETKGIAAATPWGDFGLAAFASEFAMTGAVPASRASMTFGARGLVIPDGLAPAWAADLVPTEFDLGMNVSGYDLAAPWAMLLADGDLNLPDLLPQATVMAMLPALLPEGTVDLGLTSVRVAAPLYEISGDGSMTAGPDAMPVGSAKVTAQGLSAVQARLTEAPPEIAMQGAMVLGMVSGFGRPSGDDMLVWDLELTEQGQFLVNGMDMTALGGP